MRSSRCRRRTRIFPDGGGESKDNFSTHMISAGQVMKRHRNGELALWQRRYWEHTIRHDTDFERHVDYIHFNPVKHRLVTRVRDWPHSSFHLYVRLGMLSEDWAGEVDNHDLGFGERRVMRRLVPDVAALIRATWYCLAQAPTDSVAMRPLSRRCETSARALRRGGWQTAWISRCNAVRSVGMLSVEGRMFANSVMCWWRWAGIFRPTSGGRLVLRKGAAPASQ
jgi:hypothetical protein